jgi:hypothetical protein
MYHLKNVKKFQVGGGRLLPGLVYQNDPKLMQYLSSNPASGLAGTFQVENLRLQHDAARRADAQLLQQDEQQYFNEQQAAIRNKQAEAQEARLNQQHEYEKAKYGLEAAKDFQDKITGIKYNPKHQAVFNQAMKDSGIVDDNGNMTIDTSTVDGINTATKNFFKFSNSSQIRDIIRDNAESDLLDKDLQVKQKQLEVLTSKPDNRLYYDVDGYKTKVENITKRLEDYRNNPNSTEDITKLKQDLNGLTFDYSEMGNQLNQLTLDKTKLGIEETKIDIESQRSDMELKRETLELKKRLANNDISQSEFEREMSVITGKYSGGNKPSTEQLKQQMIQTFANDLMSKNPQLPLGEAWRIATQQYEGKEVTGATGGLPQGQSYQNIPVDKDGFIEQNKVRLQDGTTFKSLKEMVESGQIVEDGGDAMDGYDNINMGYDSPNREVDWKTDKPMISIDDTGNGDGYIITNSPRVVAAILGKQDPRWADPNKWDDKTQWDQLIVDREGKRIKIPLSMIGKSNPISGGVDAYGNKATNPVEFSRNMISYIGDGMYQALRMVNPKDPSAGYWEAASKEYFQGANMQVDGLSDKEAFDGMQDDTKGLYISLAPLFKEMQAQFTSGRRVKTNADNGHGAGKGFDMQIPNTFGDLKTAPPAEKERILNAWYGRHQQSMDYMKANLVSDQSGQLGAVSVITEGTGRNRKDTYRVMGRNGSLYKFHVYLHPSSGSGTPHLDIKVLDVKKGMSVAK